MRAVLSVQDEGFPVVLSDSSRLPPEDDAKQDLHQAAGLAAERRRLALPDAAAREPPAADLATLAGRPVRGAAGVGARSRAGVPRGGHQPQEGPAAACRGAGS
eukprot:scaffold200046_cov36-Prasinocladus_malaysianus.AAC.1